MSHIKRWKGNGGRREMSLVVSEYGGATILVYDRAKIAASINYETGKESKAESDATALAKLGHLQLVATGADYARTRP